MTNTLPVRAVREKTFATPDGRYTVQLTRPRTYRDADGWVSAEWAVLVTTSDKSRVTVARGEEMMPREVALSTVDAMMRVLTDAWRHRVGTWQGDDGFDRLSRLGMWATYRRDARVHAESARPGYWGEQTATRGVRSARVAWATDFGWTFPPGYVEGYHLFPGKSTNRD
jgi:hypothetical protein